MLIGRPEVTVALGTMTDHARDAIVHTTGKRRNGAGERYEKLLRHAFSEAFRIHRPAATCRLSSATVTGGSGASCGGQSATWAFRQCRYMWPFSTRGTARSKGWTRDRKGSSPSATDRVAFARAAAHDRKTTGLRTRISRRGGQTVYRNPLDEPAVDNRPTQSRYRALSVMCGSIRP